MNARNSFFVWRLSFLLNKKTQKRKLCSTTAAKFEREIIHGFKVLSCAKNTHTKNENLKIKCQNIVNIKKNYGHQAIFYSEFFFQRKRGDETEETKNIQRFYLICNMYET